MIIKNAETLSICSDQQLFTLMKDIEEFRTVGYIGTSFLRSIHDNFCIVYSDKLSIDVTVNWIEREAGHRWFKNVKNEIGDHNA